jgi:hypothetical protein
MHTPRPLALTSITVLCLGLILGASNVHSPSRSRSGSSSSERGCSSPTTMLPRMAPSGSSSAQVQKVY